MLWNEGFRHANKKTQNELGFICWCQMMTVIEKIPSKILLGTKILFISWLYYFNGYILHQMFVYFNIKKSNTEIDNWERKNYWKWLKIPSISNLSDITSFVNFEPRFVFLWSVINKSCTFSSLNPNNIALDWILLNFVNLISITKWFVDFLI